MQQLEAHLHDNHFRYGTLKFWNVGQFFYYLNLNPILLFGTILHPPPPTSFTAFLAVNVANFIYIGEMGRRLSDRFAEHLRSVRNNDVDKPAARHFNAAKLTTLFPI